MHCVNIGREKFDCILQVNVWVCESSDDECDEIKFLLFNAMPNINLTTNFIYLGE